MLDLFVLTSIFIWVTCVFIVKIITHIVSHDIKYKLHFTDN